MMKTILLTAFIAILSITPLVVMDIFSEGKSEQPTIEFLDYNSFHEVVEYGDIVVIEFWARWNSENEYPLEELYGAEVYRVNVDTEYSLVEEYGIEVLPTILIFSDGELRYVVDSDISFKQKTTINDVQYYIDNL